MGTYAKIVKTYQKAEQTGLKAYAQSTDDPGIKPQVSAISEYGTKFLVQGDSSNEDRQTACNQIEAWASADNAVLNWHRVSTFED